MRREVIKVMIAMSLKIKRLTRFFSLVKKVMTEGSFEIKIKIKKYIIPMFLTYHSM